MVVRDAGRENGQLLFDAFQIYKMKRIREMDDRNDFTHYKCH